MHLSTVTSLHTGEESESISKFLIGNRFQVTLRIVNATTYKQRLRVKHRKAREMIVTQFVIIFKLNIKSEHKLRQTNLSICLSQITAFTASLQY